MFPATPFHTPWTRMLRSDASAFILTLRCTIGPVSHNCRPEKSDNSIHAILWYFYMSYQMKLKIGPFVATLVSCDIYIYIRNYPEIGPFVATLVSYEMFPATRLDTPLTRMLRSDAIAPKVLLRCIIRPFCHNCRPET